MTVRWREPHRISQIPYLLPGRIAIRESTTCQVFATLLCSRRSREEVRCEVFLNWRHLTKLWCLCRPTWDLSPIVPVHVSKILICIYVISHFVLFSKDNFFFFSFFFSFFIGFQPIILPEDLLRGGEQCIITFTSHITEISWEAEQLSHFRVWVRARYFTLQALSLPVHALRWVYRV